MRLYHGSYMTVNTPKILQADRKLDFGTGFYLTSSYEQAERWAILKAQRYEGNSPVISVFETDDNIFSCLKILKFEKADASWLRFVSANRNGLDTDNSFDVIIGPVANDKTMPVISLYFSGLYNEDEAIRRLLPQKLHDQYAFKTEKSLAALKFIEGVKL